MSIGNPYTILVNFRLTAVFRISLLM